MTRTLLIVLSIIGTLLISCTSTPTTNSSIEITIAGLKKGKLFLEQIQDSTLVVLDTLRVTSEEKHRLQMNIEHPEFLIVRLDKEDNNPFNDRINVFADPGLTTIVTTRENFEKDAQIVSGSHHEEFERISKMLSDFDTKSLELYQLSQEDEFLNPVAQDSLVTIARKNELRRYQYLVNYGLANPNSYLTPFVIVEQGDFLQEKWKDSIYNLLTEEIKVSTYGKQLADQLKD
jgi:hypothetical protein